MIAYSPKRKPQFPPEANGVVWLFRNGGVNRGIAPGSMTELVFGAVADRQSVKHIHSAILKQLGLDLRRRKPRGSSRFEVDQGSSMKEIRR